MEKISTIKLKDYSQYNLKIKITSPDEAIAGTHYIHDLVYDIIGDKIFINLYDFNVFPPRKSYDVWSESPPDYTLPYLKIALDNITSITLTPVK